MADVPHITLAKLPLANLRRKPFRTSALVIVVVMLTVAFYGGALLSMNLNNGLNSMRERMGADLMVTPQNTHRDQGGGPAYGERFEHVLFHQ